MPWQVPPPDGIQRPTTVQVNTLLPSDASQADAAVLQRAAGQIVDQHSSALHRFIANGRRDHSLSGRSYSHHHVEMDGLKAHLTQNGTQEKLRMNVTPHGGGGYSASTTDTNLDGYLCWVHVDPNWPDLAHVAGSPGAIAPSAPGPFLLAMNGYIIEPTFEITGPCIGYPILFGKTALLCSSYVGDVEKKNPLIGDPSFTPPNIVVPPNGWGNYTQITEIDGTVLPKIIRTLGYWIFDWENEHNLFQYLYLNLVPSNWKSPWRSTNTPVGNPVLSRGVYFASSAQGKSPLNPRGQNSIAAICTSQFAPEVEIYNLMYGEFYSRGRYRIASQSWTVPAQAGRVVAMNDSPLMFSGSNYVYDYSGDDGINFDFSLKASDTDVGDPAVPILNANGDGSSSALNTAQQAAYDGWVAKIKQINVDNYAAYLKQVSTKTDAYNAKWQLASNLKLINEAENVEQFLAVISDAEGNLIYKDGPFVVYDDAGTPFYGPTQEYWFFWDEEYNGAQMPTQALWGGYYAANTNSGVFFQATMTTPGPGNTTANNNTPMTYKQFYTWATNYAKTDALKQRSADYQAIYAFTPPDYPPFPNVSGNLDVFAHSYIEISGNSWSYNQNP
jgi:hypothetical protein